LLPPGSGNLERPASIDIDVPVTDPSRELSEVHMRIHYHGHWLPVIVTEEKLIVSFDRGWSGAVRVGYRGDVHEMEQGEARTFAIADG